MEKLTLDKAIELLKKGDPVAFPTETVYGLGADAWNPSAIQKVFDIKGRPSDNPLIVHIASKKMLEDFVEDISPEAQKLMTAFWPGPLTLIFKKKRAVPDLITAGMDTVAMRWPDHPISQDLIARAGPLVAPSANSSGKPSPTKPGHVREDFGEHFPVLEAGETNIGLESTVLDVSSKPFQIYRPGFIGKKELEEILDIIIQVAPTGHTDTTAKSPGTKYSHYAPEAIVRWLKDYEDPYGKNVLHIYHTLSPKSDKMVISYHQDYKKMAHEIYDRFRQADHNHFSEIAIEPISRETRIKNPVAEALFNRISKALSS